MATHTWYDLTKITGMHFHMEILFIGLGRKYLGLEGKE